MIGVRVLERNDDEICCTNCCLDFALIISATQYMHCCYLLGDVKASETGNASDAALAVKSTW